MSDTFFHTQIEPALREYLYLNNHVELTEAIGWVLYTFNLESDFALIDQISEVYDSFFGI